MELTNTNNNIETFNDTFNEWVFMEGIKMLKSSYPYWKADIADRLLLKNWYDTLLDKNPGITKSQFQKYTRQYIKENNNGPESAYDYAMYIQGNIFVEDWETL